MRPARLLFLACGSLALSGCLKVVAQLVGDGGQTECSAINPCPTGQYCDFQLQACATSPGTSGLFAPSGTSTCRSDCGGGCVSCQTDSDCSATQRCDGHNCQPFECPALGLKCTTACPASNVPHGCPVCLCTACATSENCPDAPCPNGLTCCGGAYCSDTTSDTLNCGFCGNHCLAGNFCSATQCVAAECLSDPPCTTNGQTCCGAQCCSQGQVCCGSGTSTLSCQDADAGACLPIEMGTD
jgi:hypothetical protein